MTTAETKTITK